MSNRYETMEDHELVELATQRFLGGQMPRIGLGTMEGAIRLAGKVYELGRGSLADDGPDPEITDDYEWIDEFLSHLQTNAYEILFRHHAWPRRVMIAALKTWDTMKGKQHGSTEEAVQSQTGGPSCPF